MYFKYSDYDLLDNGISYVGMFRVEQQNFYKEYTGVGSLSSDNTFFKNFNLQLMNFDNIFDEIEDIDVTPNKPYKLINKQFIDKTFDTFNSNNLTIYKSLVTVNPLVFDKQNVKFYTLSAPDTELFLSSDPLHSETLDTDITWEFINRIKVGALVPTSDDTFKYVCSTGTDIISLSGSFTNSELSIIDKVELDLGIEIQNIIYSEEDERLNIIQNDKILIYDGLIYKNCTNLILLDVIKLDDIDIRMFKWSSEIKFADSNFKWRQKYDIGNPNNPEFIRFGKKYRTSIDEGFLFILNKYSSDIIEIIDLKKRSIEDLITCTIREIDDKIAILHTKYNNVEGLFITYIDMPDMTFSTHEMMKMSPNFEKYQLKFSNFDSDLIFISNSKEYQIRSISNSKYPLGKVNEDVLKYPPNFIWGITNRLFGNPKIKWNTKNQPSNSINFITTDNVFVSDTSFHVIVANSRFYVIKQKIPDFYKYRIDSKIDQKYSTPGCVKSSFGVYFNDNLFSIIDDLIALHYQAHCKYKFTPDETLLNTISNIEIDLKNIHLHTNENIHTLNIQRIFEDILNIQRKLISISQTIE
jgi:hypothetical protein